MTRVVTIWYADDESGPAEVLAGKVARIVDAPLMTSTILKDDLVRLDRDPRNSRGYPRIAEVVHTRHPERCRLVIHSKVDFFVLRTIFAILDAECHLILPPGNDKPGFLTVGHSEDIDPISLAIAIGIQQPDEEDEPIPQERSHPASPEETETPDDTSVQAPPGTQEQQKKTEPGS